MLIRSVLGYAFVCVGGATLAFSGSRYAAGAWHQQQARLAWNEARARAVVALARRTATMDAQTATLIATGAPVAHLVIPRLSLDEIVLEGVDDNTLNAGPGHLPGSALPGERGNAVVSAHRDRHFAKLGDVRVGDTLFTESAALRTTWVVTARRVIDAGAPALFRASDATLTLTTCWPIRYIGTAPDRLLITARPISSTGSFASRSSS